MAHAVFVAFLIVLLAMELMAQNEIKPLIAPTMGWRPRLAFTCNWDCKKDPVDCVNELLYVEIADIMFSDGFLKAGYTLIYVDDCENERFLDRDHHSTIDSWRFPTGIRFLSNYFHERGLEFGIRQSQSHRKCIHLHKDLTALSVEKLKELRTDFVEMNMCDEVKIRQAAPEMLVYCNGNQLDNQKMPPKHCDLYRPQQIGRLQESWQSLSTLLDQVIRKQDKLISLRQQGKWLDFGELLVGSEELTARQWRLQMSLFCIWSVPLMMSVDLRSISKRARQILLNEMAIDINQDELGEMGRMILERDNLNYFIKRIEPCDEPRICSYALAIVNRSNQTITANFKLFDLNIPYQLTFRLQNVWSGRNFYPTLYSPQRFKVASEDAYLFTVLPLDSNGNIHEKRETVESRPQRKRKNHGPIQNDDVKATTNTQPPTIYDLISATLTSILYFELILLGGIALCKAVSWLRRLSHTYIQ